MPLSLLLTTSGLCAYYDNAADILLLDLQGHLTLATMQLIEKEVLQLAMQRPYAQVIISTYYLSGLEPVAQQRLQQALAPGLRLLGVQKLAWVCQFLPACMVLAHAMLTDLPMATSLFNDLEHAVSWLPGYLHAWAGPAGAHLATTRLLLAAPGT
jgi:hypothetical protein